MIVGSIDVFVVACWVGLSLEYLTQQPDNAKRILRKILTLQQNHLSPGKELTDEEIDKTYAFILANGNKFMDSIDQALDDCDKLLAEEEAKLLGKENMN